MAIRRFDTVVFAVVVAAALVQGLKAETHDVGDDMEWTVPSGGAAAYERWAAAQTFRAGDILGTYSETK